MARQAVEIPKVGLVMETVKLLRWLKSVGETIAPGELLVEVESEKSIVEIEAPVGGRLVEILVQPDEEVSVGAPIAFVENDQLQTDQPEMQAAQPSAAAPQASGAAPLAPVEAGERSGARASPAARRLAKEHGIDLARLQGSGPGGRIQLEDVEAAVAAKAGAQVLGVAPAHAAAKGAAKAGAPAAVAAEAGSPAVVSAKASSAAAVAAEASATAAMAYRTGAHGAGAPDGQRLPLSPMRRAVARAMTLSNATVPQFAVARSVDWSEALEVRAALAARLAGQAARPTLNDFLLQAVARTLLEHSGMNAVFMGDVQSPEAHIVRSSGVHLGLVVAVEDGLLVPVLHGIEDMSVAELARRRSDLVERALAGRLRREEMSGATFTISNLGAAGPDRFTAMLNPPESGILAVGRMREAPVVTPAGIVARPVSDLSLTVDHRLIDGRLASAFLARLVQILEGRDWRLE